jgi:ankyrin repeat protein
MEFQMKKITIFSSLMLIAIRVVFPAHAMQNDADLGKQLIVAAAKGDNKEIEQLIKAGAPVGYENNMGSTALQIAASHGHLSCMQTLIAQKAQINQTNIYGSTALMRAAESGHLPCVKALIAAGAQDNLATQLNWIALTHAINNSNQTMCELFVERMLWIPTKDQKAKIITFLGIAKFRKSLCLPELDANLRNQFKAAWPTAVYEDNKKNFANSIAYQELDKIQKSGAMQNPLGRKIIEDLFEKYNPGGNSSKSKCTVQ